MSYYDKLKKYNKLTPHEFSVSMTDSNGTFIKLDEVNDMINHGVLTVNYDKLEHYIYQNNVIHI